MGLLQDLFPSGSGVTHKSKWYAAPGIKPGHVQVKAGGAGNELRSSPLDHICEFIHSNYKWNKFVRIIGKF